MLKKLSSVALSLMVMALTALPVMAQPDNERIPIDWYMWNGCVEEAVHVVGTIHWKVDSFDDGNGGYHFRFHENWQNTTGQGLSTGAEYRIVGSGRNVYRFAGEGGAETLTEVTQTGFIAKGTAENSIIQLTWHLVVNPNGDVAVDRVDSRLFCK